ncbi:unnamed protein product [Cylindrotheca closterium]|uniref:Fe2OG dioxygenase domain-containing protein n=1 Tax=Cylindrotheca closterium TaxID=2856 RepID=A0AAD2FHH0_9STRA|nr:unnamed protein product [Cylindrotheca closterium]
MLLYEPGGHFSKHRGTEKEPGMFATMVIQLPSKHTGGCLQIHHNGAKRQYDWSGAKSDNGFFATAFFADCEHELLPVTSGYRLCLVYNLNLDPVQGYLLDHKYTKKNLHFRNLKGRDLEIASLLRNAIDEHGNKLFVVCLLLLEKHEFCDAECGYRGYGYDEDDGPYTMQEVVDSSVSADHWIGPDDTKLSQFTLPFDEEENLLVDDPEDGVFEEDPDDEEYEAYTGNAGPTLEYWYRKSAAVFWPRTKQLEIAKRAGRSFLESYLEASTVESDVQAHAKQLVSLLEEKRSERLTGKAIRAIARSKDDALIIRLLDRVQPQIPRDDVALAIVEALQVCSSECLKQSFFTMLCRVSNMEQPSKQKLAAEELKHGSAFVRLLQSRRGLKDYAARAKEAIFASVIEHLDSTVRASSSNNIGQLTGQFIDELALFKQIVDIVVTVPTFVGPTLKHVMTLVPDATCNEYIVQLAKVRAQQLVSATRDGEPHFT